jgi:uncharacterized protein
VTRHRWNPFLRYPRASLVVVAALCLPWLGGLARFRVRSELKVLLEGDRRNLESYEKVEQVLKDTEVVVLSLEVPEVFSPAGIEAVRRVSDAFEREPGVTDVKSLTHSSKPVRRGMAFEMVPFVPSGPVSAEALRKLKAYSLQQPLVRNLMVAEDSRHAVIMVTYRRDLDTVARQRELKEEIDRVLRPFREEGLHFQILALPLVEEEVRTSLRSDLSVMLPAALGLLVTILWLTFRSWRYVFLVLANQGAVLVLLPGLVQGAGFSLTVFSVMLLPLLTGIHLTLLAHVYTSLQRALPECPTGRAAVERMLGEVFKSCAFAAITTLFGLGSLLLSDVRQIREFGLMGSMGMGLIFFMTFGPGLAFAQWVARFLTVFPAAGKEREPETASAPDRGPAGRKPADWAGRLTRFVQRRSRAIVTGAAVAAAVAVVGIGRIRTDIRALEFLNRESPTRQAMETLDRTYGGINVVQIEFDSGEKNGINEGKFLHYLERVQNYVQSQPEVSGVYSYAQLLAMMNQIWEGDKPEALKVPENALLKNLFVLALTTGNYPFLTALADRSFRTAYLVMRTQDMPARRYLKLLRDVVNYANASKPDQVTVSASRGLHSILEADRTIVRSQVRTAGVTVALIGLVLAVLWRSLRLALFALLTNVIPVALVMGAAGFADVPLNSITVMVAAVALGIAVDDSVHFITHWREERAWGAGSSEALSRTLEVKGRPIIATSAALVAIFSLFALSSFPPVVHFGVLCAVAFSGALLAVLVLLPALLGRSSDG